MAMKVVTEKQRVATAALHMAQPHELATMIRDEALVAAHDKLGVLQGDLATWLRRSDFFDYFMHALAAGVAEALAEHDPNVQAIYLYDPSLNPDSESGEALPTSTIMHLLIQVTRPSAALDAFLAGLDRALTASLKELPSPRFQDHVFVIDVTLITDDEVRDGRGNARLLSAVFSPPLPIWRQAA